MTEEEQTVIGHKLVEVLMLRKDRKYLGRYQTTWGNKTPLGIYRTVIRIVTEENKQ